MPRINILHVDDEAVSEFLLETVLATFEPPVRLLSVSSGPEAIAYLAGTGPYGNRSVYPLPDLILADVNMPELSGFEVLRFVRQMGPCRDLPFFMLTSSETPTDRALAEELGATGYIVKDVGFRGLKAKLAEVMKDLPALTQQTDGD